MLLAKTADFHTETAKVLESNGKKYLYPESIIPLLTEANLIHIEEESSDHISYTFLARGTITLSHKRSHFRIISLSFSDRVRVILMNV